VVGRVLVAGGAQPPAEHAGDDDGGEPSLVEALGVHAPALEAVRGMAMLTKLVGVR
jgi:hypothetical protein